MKLLIFWNVLLTACLGYSLYLHQRRDPTPYHLLQLGASSAGDQIMHGLRRPGKAAVESRVSGGALALVQYTREGMHPDEPKSHGVTLSADYNGSSISVSNVEPDGETGISARLSAGAKDANSTTDGARLFLSDLGGGSIVL